MQVTGKDNFKFFEVSKCADVMTSALQRKDTPLARYFPMPSSTPYSLMEVIFHLYGLFVFAPLSGNLPILHVSLLTPLLSM